MTDDPWQRMWTIAASALHEALPLLEGESMGYVDCMIEAHFSDEARFVEWRKENRVDEAAEQGEIVLADI
jgi:hypothetical protein